MEMPNIISYNQVYMRVNGWQQAGKTRAGWVGGIFPSINSGGCGTDEIEMRERRDGSEYAGRETSVLKDENRICIKKILIRYV